MPAGAARYGALLGVLFLACTVPRRSAVSSPEPTASKVASAENAVVRDADSENMITRRNNIEETIFGVKVADPYRWLEDEDSPEVQSWMKEQDRRARQYLSQLPKRQPFLTRLKELLYIEQRSAPSHHLGRYFFTVKPADKEKAIHFVREGVKGEARVLLDPNEMSEDGSLSIGGVFPDHRGKLAAYLEKVNNADASTLKLIDVGTGALLVKDTIEGVRYTTPSWMPDGKSFYYTWTPTDPTIDEAERTAFAEIRLHVVGTDPRTDKTVHPPTGDASRWLSGGVSYDGKYFFVSVGHGWSKSEVFFRKTADATLTEMTDGRDALYSVSTYRDQFFVLTDEDAPRFRVFKVDPNRPRRADWNELIPEDPSAVIEQLSVVGGHLVVRYLRNAYTEIKVFSLNGNLVRDVALPEIGTASSFLGHEEEDTAYFAFSSFTHPTEVYETSVKNGGRTLYTKNAAPVDPGMFEVRQQWFESKDGTRVPMFVLHRTGVALNGKNPTLLYGYGGFNNSMLPSFTASLFPWLEAGGVYAMPNLRGGGEFGEAWHRAGMLDRKQNVFDDFIAAAEYLIRKGYTSAEHLAISGRSNGGLLVGAAMTQRPELFRAALCGVPLLDMIRYHRFGLGKAWIPEYGSPEKADQFPTLLSYSPYHHVKEGTRYPTLLMASADTDDRVDPLHARKFVASIQHASSTVPAAWLRIETNSGHGGADLRSKYAERTADEFAFLWQALTTPGANQ